MYFVQIHVCGKPLDMDENEAGNLNSVTCDCTEFMYNLYVLTYYAAHVP